MFQTNARWLSTFSVYGQPRVLAMIFLGFSAGLPFSLVSTTLSAWLSDAHVSLAVIGYFSLVGVAYSVKVLWAPLVDQWRLPWLYRGLGKRRSWLLLSQCGIAAGLFAISTTDVAHDLHQVALLAVVVAFCSATQDIVIDAYRIEAMMPRYQGAMAAAYVLGYRLALLVAGAGAFYLAQFWSWTLAYQCLALMMGLGIVTTLMLSEPDDATDSAHSSQSHPQPQTIRAWLAWLSHATVDPFREFFQRNGRLAGRILLVIALYKLSDIAMGVMANPFYLDLGFSKKDIADVTKVFGFFMTIAGTSIGGLLVLRFGIMRPLLLGAIIGAATNLLFALLASVQPTLTLLACVISADNLCGGIAAASFIAYLSSLTNSAYTATQYALFSSLMTLPSKLVASLSGELAASLGYAGFFVYSAVMGLPAIVLVMLLMRQSVVSDQSDQG